MDILLHLCSLLSPVLLFDLYASPTKQVTFVFFLDQMALQFLLSFLFLLGPHIGTGYQAPGHTNLASMLLL